MRDREYLRDVRKRKIQRKKRISKAVYGFDWYSHDGNIQKEKYIVGVDCANLVKSMDCRQLKICEKNRENGYC